MSSDEHSDSESEYAPSASEEEESDWSDVSYGSDEEFDENEPIVEEGWSFMADPFKDERPDPLPDFTTDATGISGHVSQFQCPRDAFTYFFDSEVMDKLCEWMNNRANEYFAVTGKRKVNGLLWRPVDREHTT